MKEVVRIGNRGRRGQVSFVSLVVLLSLLFLLPTMGFCGESEIVDEGQAGEPHSPADHSYVHQSTPVSYSGMDDALSGRFNDGQISQLTTMMQNDFGIDVGSLNASAATGVNDQRVQWRDPRPEPDGPTVNFETVTMTTPEGWTITVHTQCTGAEGNYASSDNGGGTGTAWISITDAEGNQSWIQLCITNGEIVYQNFHAEDLIRDNATVIIQGPSNVDEDVENSWTLDIPDSNLPDETEEVYEVRWSGGPEAQWEAQGGTPAEGSGDTFATVFKEPGSATITVEATRSYEFKTMRAEPNPNYVEGTSPIEEAFIQTEAQMSGRVRGSASKTVSIADITPPDLTFHLMASHDVNDIVVKEAPLDKAPPKTVSVEIKGNNFTLDIPTPLLLTGLSAPATEPIEIGPSLSSSLLGFCVRRHERFKLFADCSDNYSASEALKPHWSIKNVTKDVDILPDGQSEYALIRRENIVAFQLFHLLVAVADEAGNETRLLIPIQVIGQSVGVDTMNYEGKKK